MGLSENKPRVRARPRQVLLGSGLELPAIRYLRSPEVPAEEDAAFPDGPSNALSP